MTRRLASATLEIVLLAAGLAWSREVRATQNVATTVGASAACATPGGALTVTVTGRALVDATNAHVFLCCEPGTTFGAPQPSSTGNAPCPTFCQGGFVQCQYASDAPANGVGEQCNGAGPFPTGSTVTMAAPLTVSPAASGQFRCAAQAFDAATTTSGVAYFGEPVAAAGQNCNPPPPSDPDLTPFIGDHAGIVTTKKNEFVTDTDLQNWLRKYLPHNSQQQVSSDVVVATTECYAGTVGLDLYTAKTPGGQPLFPNAVFLTGGKPRMKTHASQNENNVHNLLPVYMQRGETVGNARDQARRQADPRLGDSPQLYGSSGASNHTFGGKKSTHVVIFVGDLSGPANSVTVKNDLDAIQGLLESWQVSSGNPKVEVTLLEGDGNHEFTSDSGILHDAATRENLELTLKYYGPKITDGEQLILFFGDHGAFLEGGRPAIPHLDLAADEPSAASSTTITVPMPATVVQGIQKLTPLAPTLTVYAANLGASVALASVTVSLNGHSLGSLSTAAATPLLLANQSTITAYTFTLSGASALNTTHQSHGAYTQTVTLTSSSGTPLRDALAMIGTGAIPLQLQ